MKLLFSAFGQNGKIPIKLFVVLCKFFVTTNPDAN